MKIVGLSGSIVGSKTRTVMNYLSEKISVKHSDVEFMLIDLADYDIQFSDGRHYMAYEGDTGSVAKLSTINSIDRTAKVAEYA